MFCWEVSAGANSLASWVILDHFLIFLPPYQVKELTISKKNSREHNIKACILKRTIIGCFLAYLLLVIDGQTNR